MNHKKTPELEKRNLIAETMKIVASLPDDKARDLALVAAGYEMAESRRHQSTA